MRVIHSKAGIGGQAQVRIRRVSRATHLRIIEQVGPRLGSTSARVVPFHTHPGPLPAA